MRPELLEPAVLFALMILGFVFGGFLDARISSKHPDTKARLGHLFSFGRDSRNHSARWFRFTTYEHFRANDPLLSSLCIAQTALWLAVVTKLFGLWSITGT